jgi:hypothetical protein
MSAAAFDLYAQVRQATDNEPLARIIAEAFDALEARFPRLTDLATQGHVRESELRLQKEIKEVEARLQKEIKELEARLQKEIKEVELQIKQVEVNLHRAIVAQTRWYLGGLAALGVIFKLADLLIGP